MFQGGVSPSQGESVESDSPRFHYIRGRMFQGWRGCFASNLEGFDFLRFHIINFHTRIA